MKYLGKITDFETLKKEYRKLALKLHPDGGGSEEEMKILNSEYEQRFPILKSQFEYNSKAKVKETYQSDIKEFYTQNGWEGSRYNSNLSTKDIAKLIREYIKETFPTWKFSVTSEYFSMGSSISVILMEAPYEIYTKETLSQITEEEYGRKQSFNYCISDRDNIFNQDTKDVLKNVVDFVNSYNYDDSDSMVDYFDTNFYTSFGVGKWDKPFKVVPKEDKKVKKLSGETSKQETQTETTSTNLEIIEDIHTQTNEKLFIVKITDKLSKDDYIKVNKQMKDLGGYYSKFKHGFIFKDKPTFENNLLAI